MREELDDERAMLARSTRYLSRANAYRRLRRHVAHSLTPHTSSLSPRRIARAQATLEDPWRYTSDSVEDRCVWCQRDGHKVESCAFLRICQLCHQPSHLERDCYQPHQDCVSFDPCRVPPTHQYRDRQACRSTVTLEREWL
jgi:hypothetical protein